MLPRAIPVVLLLLALTGGLSAEEDTAGVRCELAAIRYSADARLLKIYDGLRRGLEKARLGRVCESAPSRDDPAALAAFVKRAQAEQAAAQAGKGPQPVLFAFGDAAAEVLRARATSVPRVFVVTRYSMGGKPLAPLPEPEGPGSVIYADLPLADVGKALVRLAQKSWPVVRLAWAAPPKGTPLLLERLSSVAGVQFVVGAPSTSDDGKQEARKGDIVLHARFGLGESLLSVRDATRLARSLRVPLVSDDPLQFGKGLATVVLASQHDLVGRYAAEAARVLSAHPDKRLETRAVSTLRVLVDLGAADRQGLRMPLVFLARAHALRRGLPAPRRGSADPAKRKSGS